MTKQPENGKTHHGEEMLGELIEHLQEAIEAAYTREQIAAMTRKMCLVLMVESPEHSLVIDEARWETARYRLLYGDLKDQTPIFDTDDDGHWVYRLVPEVEAKAHAEQGVVQPI